MEQHVKKGSGKRLGGACSLVSPFVSAMSNESQSGNVKKMEIGNLRNQVESMKSIIDEEMKKEHELRRWRKERRRCFMKWLGRQY